jgi:hypothetical protein
MGASILSTQVLKDLIGNVKLLTAVKQFILIGNVKKPFLAFFELRSVALTGRDKLNWT